MKKYKEVPISTTMLDSHGDKLSKELLNHFKNNMPESAPLNLSHDQTNPIMGTLTNYKIKRLSSGEI